MLEMIGVWLLDALAELAIAVVFFVIAAADMVIMTGDFRTWVKTVAFFCNAGAVLALLLWLTAKTYQNGNPGGGLACLIVCTVLAAMFLWGGIRGHRMDWKHPEDGNTF